MFSFIQFKLTGDLSASDTSLVDLVERHRGPLPQELMPLPSSGRDSPLEWTHLVDVATFFSLLPVQRSYVFGDSNHRTSGASSPQQPHIELQPAPLSRPSSRTGEEGDETRGLGEDASGGPEEVGHGGAGAYLQQSMGRRRGTPWTGRQSIAGQLI
ncbi:hypothetical protein XENORESO_001692, partial [Xenotaenia resolanae]